MGQNIKYIITTENLNIPIYIISFKEKNSTIFPILLEDNDFEDISKYSEKSNDNVFDFFDMILCGGYHLEFPTRRLFEFIQMSKIRSFAIITYREFMDIPQNIGKPILFLDNELCKINSDYTEEQIHQKLNSEITFNEIINNEEKYWNYGTSELIYLKNLNKTN